LEMISSMKILTERLFQKNMTLLRTQNCLCLRLMKSKGYDMLKVFKIIFSLTFLVNMAWANYCADDYNCSKKLNKKSRVYELHCHLPAMPTFPITAPNVLNSDGTPKKYFQTNNTVCDVLGLDE